MTGTAYVSARGRAPFDGEPGSTPGAALGEVVFTTGMTGYQESLTDPSFAGQIITFTAPMIGNYGVQSDVGESDAVQVRALICREARNAQPPGRDGLIDWLDAAGVPVLTGIDTRALVRHLRERGAMRGAVVTDGTPPAEAAERIAALAPMAGQDLAAAVSRPARQWPATKPRARVTVLDYGAKDSIARLLAEAGADVTVVPHDATAAEVAATDPDGVLLANGPGDPGVMDEHVAERARHARRRPAAVRHLPRAPAARPGARPGDVQAPLRPPRCQPPGARAGHRPRAGDEPEPRLRGRRARRARTPTSSSPTSRSTTARSRACGSPTATSGRCSSTPRPRPGRTTRATRCVRFVEIAAAHAKEHR